MKFGRKNYKPLLQRDDGKPLPFARPRVVSSETGNLLGFTTLILAFFIGADALISWFRGVAVSGFATVIITLLLIGSFVMISLGIMGEYIAKIYEEVKRRPSFIVEASTDEPSKRQ